MKNFNLKRITQSCKSLIKSTGKSCKNSLQRPTTRAVTAGVATVLLTSYALYYRNKKNDYDIKVGNHEVKKSIAELLKKVNFMKIAEDAQKEETMREKFNFIKNVVNSCAPAVFYLEIRDPYRKDLETGEPLITSNGSGFIISEDGWALTNAHVVLNKPQSKIRAIMKDGKTYKVKIEDADMNIDIALLKIDALEKLPFLEFASNGDTNVGEWVVALGSPLSLSNSVTVGIVSCVDRPAEDLGLKNYSMSYIQTDASITFGNSGGPLVNLDGNVIGINNLRLTSGISFAIPVQYAKKFLENSKYRIKHGNNDGVNGKTSFGITTISITPEVITELLRYNKHIPKDVTQGLLVWKILNESNAAKSGMEVGDIITHVNGTPVKEANDLYLNNDDSRSDVTFNLIHRGKRKTIVVSKS